MAGVFGDTVLTLYTYGSHDNHEISGYENAFFTGPAVLDGYYVYGISFAQMAYDTDAQALSGDKPYVGKDLADRRGISAQTASHHFLTWVRSLDDHKPIIVMSHVPLHADRADNRGAWTWTQALNLAAQKHDIIFLWGHNHTLESRSSSFEIEKANYLLQPGEIITVQSWGVDAEGNAVTKWTTESQPGEKKKSSATTLIFQKETLNFIYMNAGYITAGVGTVLTFTDTDDNGTFDILTARRYGLEDADTAYGTTGIGDTWTYDLRHWEE